MITTGSALDLESALSDLPRVELFHHAHVSTDRSGRYTHRITIVAHEPYPFLLGVILRGRGIPNRLELHDDHFNGTVTVEQWNSFRTLADRIEDQFGRFELLSVNQVETIGDVLGGGQLGRVLQNELSEQQLSLLRTAHRMGYFNAPRKVASSDIANELNIAQSTFSERLRLAQKRLFDLVFPN